jgi:hypothetical protein
MGDDDFTGQSDEICLNVAREYSILLFSRNKDSGHKLVFPSCSRTCKYCGVQWRCYAVAAT